MSCICTFIRFCTNSLSLSDNVADGNRIGTMKINNRFIIYSVINSKGTEFFGIIYTNYFAIYERINRSSYAICCLKIDSLMVSKSGFVSIKITCHLSTTTIVESLNHFCVYVFMRNCTNIYLHSKHS